MIELRAQELTDHHGLGDACAVLLLQALLELGIRGESECVMARGCVDEQVELGGVAQEDVGLGDFRVAGDAGGGRSVVAGRADESQHRGEECVVDGVAGVEGDVIREVLEVGLRQGLRARVGLQRREQGAEFFGEVDLL